MKVQSEYLHFPGFCHAISIFAQYDCHQPHLVYMDLSETPALMGVLYGYAYFSKKPISRRDLPVPSS